VDGIDRIGRNKMNRTKVDHIGLNRTRMDQIRPKWTELTE